MKNSMRKLVVTLAAVLVASVTFAQKSNVSKAYNRLYTEPVDYDAARNEIGLAKENPETAKDAKTWYVAGRIGYSYANKAIAQSYIGQAYDVELVAAALDEMYTNYVEANKYDGVLDKKGNMKYKYRKDIKNDFKELKNSYLNMGVGLFEQQKFGAAYTMFADYTKLIDLPIYEAKDGMVKDSTYYTIMYYAALSAYKNDDTASAVEMCNTLKSSPSNDKAEVYKILANVYQADSAKYLGVLTEAAEACPSEIFFATSLLNHYIDKGAYDVAEKYIDQLMVRDPNNVEFYAVKAEMLIQQKKYNEARSLMENALAMDKNNARTYFTMGKIWAIEGAAIQEDAEKIADNAKYNAEMKRGIECFKTALPYYEKSKELIKTDDPNYSNLLQNMKVSYLRVGDKQKYNEVKTMLENL